MKKTLCVLLLAVTLLCLPVSATAAQANHYTDAETGLSLTLPQDWDLEYEEDGLIQVTFVPNGNGSARMQYGSSEFDEDSFTKAGVAELVGCSGKDVKRITMNGREHYRAAFEKEVVSGKTSFVLDMTFWVHWENGRVYLYQYVGKESGVLYEQFRDMVSGAVYGEPESSKAPADTFEKAVAAYEDEDYETAKELFLCASNREESSKYLRLLRIRSAGSNTGMGSGVYDEALGLTDADRKDIEEAAAEWDFADTAQVLLCNSDVACHYLTGLWSGESSSYIQFKPGNYGYYYTIGAKLSTQKQKRFSIVDGELFINSDTDPILKLTLTGPDTMDVVTYEKDNSSYTLTRK